MTSAFAKVMTGVDPALLTFDKLLTLQVNLGNLCNQKCEHCHLQAGPEGEKAMDKQTVDRVVGILRERPGVILDVTGGCPELNPNFRYLLERASGLVRRLMVRTNLSVLLEPGMDWLPEFYHENSVVLIGSMPCYTQANVAIQRGDGVYDKSIAALKLLNQIGYGDLHELNLVYNPGADALPGAQDDLERDYKQRLEDDHGIRFSNLFTITNAPLGRFKQALENTGRFAGYMKLLEDSFNPQAAPGIMCRSLISVDWQGKVYDCDFNQALGSAISRDGRELSLEDIEAASAAGREITVDDHCFCCTAGAGSSCGGSLA